MTQIEKAAHDGRPIQSRYLDSGKSKPAAKIQKIKQNKPE